LPVLDELLAEKKLPPADRLAALAAFDAVLGLNLLHLTREELRIRPANAILTAEQIHDRLVERQQARVVKDFQRSDTIRDELTAAGVEVMDGDPLGWDWKPAL
jgi:cysteinyl-tRNA synthetase